MEDAERVPSTEQLVLLYRVWCAFTGVAEGKSNFAVHRDEDKVLGYFIKLADTITPLRGLFGRCRGWPPPMEAAVKVIIGTFDRYTMVVGWKALADPARRTDFLKERHAEFFEKYERPLAEAALSVERDLGLAKPPDDVLLQFAHWGRARGLSATLPRNKALGAYKAAKKRYQEACRYGRRRPTDFHEIIPEYWEEGSDICRAVAILGDTLKYVTGRQHLIWRPEEDQESAGGAQSEQDLIEETPTPIPSPPAAAPPSEPVPPDATGGRTPEGEQAPEAPTSRTGRSIAIAEPPQHAIDAYRLFVIKGQDQATVAKRFGVTQGTISRWKDKVVRWIKAGNVLPDLDAPKPATVTMDPRNLEQGRRLR